VIGDVHGCAAELRELLERLRLGPDDQVLGCGDLFHRGPDPVGVWDLLRTLPRFRTVLGNHEWALLQRLGVAGARADGSDARVPDARWTLPDGADLRGDNGAGVDPSFATCAAEIVRWCARFPYFLRGTGALGDRPWLIVHGSVPPGRAPEYCAPRELVRLVRAGAAADAPPWYADYAGDDFVLYGHVQSGSGEHRDADGVPRAHGLDTGCVYGGSLTTFRLRDGALESVPARRRYFRKDAS